MRSSDDVKAVPSLNGQSFLSIKIRANGVSISFEDSYRILNMSLASFNKALGLNENVKKGYFPHYWNTPQNQNYLGSYPDKKYYGYDTMKPGAQKQFSEWYDSLTNHTFDFQKEIIEYCIDDVKVLRAGCLKFRQDFIDMMTSRRKEAFDPFDSGTSAQFAMNAYTRNFLKTPLPVEKIPRNFNQSNEAYQFLSWYAHSNNIKDFETFQTGEHIITLLMDSVNLARSLYNIMVAISMVTRNAWVISSSQRKPIITQ
jgi:hypothetical protein